jgi:hypothetical protein
VVFPVFRLSTDFVCLLTYEFCLSLWKIALCSVIFLLPLFATYKWYVHNGKIEIISLVVRFISYSALTANFEIYVKI